MDASGNIRMLEKGEVPEQNERLLSAQEAFHLKRMNAKHRKNWMRNQLCSCGSGKKTKKCCWSKMAKMGKGE